VVDGKVACPRSDLVDWEGCIDCHLLEDVEGGRDQGCGASESSTPPLLPEWL
jgi:hypothetical protein